MLLSRRQLQVLYSSSVQAIKEIKSSNDKINKRLGMVGESSLHQETEGQREIIEATVKKIQGQIIKMEENYVDPDTARKIIVLKQQLTIQKDRRLELLQCVNKQHKQWVKANKKEETTNEGSPRIKKQGTPHPYIQMEKGKNHNLHKESILSGTDERETALPYQQDMMELDTEMERKYMEDRSHQLHEAEKKIISIRDVLSDTELLAQEQGQHLDIIQENFSSSHKNVILANDELSEANTRHKKSKKKYLMLALTVLLVIGTVLVIVLLL